MKEQREGDLRSWDKRGESRAWERVTSRIIRETPHTRNIYNGLGEGEQECNHYHHHKEGKHTVWP
jgi:hypothetical protein